MDANLDSPNSNTNTNTITTTTPSNDVVSLETNNDDDDYYYDESNYSTPYASAPSSPLNQTTSFFFHSAPTSPMHYGLTIDDGTGRSAIAPAISDASSSAASFEFEFSYRFDSSNSPEIGESMSTADELFLNGQIRPMKLSAHLSTDQDDEIKIPRDLRLRSKSQRRTRSMSPFRNTTPFDWLTESTPEKTSEIEMDGEKIEENVTKNGEQSSSSSSSSRCSSAGRSSKRWLFLKDFLRSKSEGRSNTKFWQNISFSPAKEKKRNGDAAVAESAVEAKKSGGGGGGKEGQVKKAAAAAKRRSAHEMHYAAKRAEAEEMRKKTYLPYRQGLFGCIGFHSSNGYGGGVLHDFARVLNPVSSR